MQGQQMKVVKGVLRVKNVGACLNERGSSVSQCSVRGYKAAKKKGQVKNTLLLHCMFLAHL